jgi:hypothetical protein
MPDKKPELADGFIQFSRIGRWGTCVACPRDTDGHVYPEFCRYTDRYVDVFKALASNQEAVFDKKNASSTFLSTTFS